MKILLFCILLVSQFSFAHIDEAPLYPTGEKLPKKAFFEVIRLVRDEFQYLAQQNGRKLEILTDYQSDWAQAFARRWDTDQVLVYGAITAIRGGSEDSFALLLCHELGHLYGGEPYSDTHNKLSVEGQADYWSSRCFKKILPKLPLRTGKRLEEAALVLTAFYADNSNLQHPETSTPDLSQVQTTLKVHPEPQCRLDTILAGETLKGRPLCWFRPSF